jgi:TrpR family transcriptional regulator, trp operon repressor
MNELGWRQFIKLCLMSKDEKILSSVLEFFLTHEEKENLGMRYLIIKELMAQEKPQRQIAQDLNVSIANITRGSNELKRIKPTLKEYLFRSVVLSRDDKASKKKVR